jgi:hypothetical protein
MTRGKGIMGIFCQKRHFSKVLVIGGAIVQALVVWGAIQKNCGSLGAKLYFGLKESRVVYVTQFPST